MPAHTTPPPRGETSRCAVRLLLALGLLLLAMPQASALGILPSGHPYLPAKTQIQHDFDIIGMGYASASASENGLRTCLEFDDTSQRVDVDLSDGGVMFYALVLSPDSDQPLDPDRFQGPGGTGLPGGVEPPAQTLGPYDVAGKQFGWGTREAGYAPNGCP